MHHADRLGFLLDHEVTARDSRRVTRRLAAAMTGPAIGVMSGFSSPVAYSLLSSVRGVRSASPILIPPRNCCALDLGP